MNTYRISTKEKYDQLLKSGMFWICYPELSGNWEADKEIIMRNDIIEQLVSYIKPLLKDSAVYICPKCMKVATIVTNPFYYWKCGECGHEASYRSLPIKRSDDFVKDKLSDMVGRIILKNDK